jgi:hypothetical protein
MVQKRTPETSWDSAPRTTVPVADMSERTQNDIGTFTHNVLERGQGQGAIKWDEFGGHGGFNGLEERLNNRIKGAAHFCGREACGMELSLVEIASGDTSASTLEIMCPVQGFVTRREAREAEAQCMEAHAATVEGFEGWVSCQNTQILYHQGRIRHGQNEIADAEGKLDDLL